MIDSPETLTLSAHWYNRPLQGREYPEQMNGYLRVLQALDQRFSRIYLVGNSRGESKPLDLAAADFEQALIGNLPKEWAYINEDSTHKEFTPTCRTKLGFSNSFVTSPDRPVLMLQSVIGKMAPTAANSIVLYVDKESEDAELLKRLFKATVEYWRPYNASFMRPAVEAIFNRPVGQGRVGWLTYLNRATASTAVPSDIKWEALADGLLIEATETAPFKDDVQAVSRIRRTLEALEAAGVLVNPVKKAPPALHPQTPSSPSRH